MACSGLSFTFEEKSSLETPNTRTGDTCEDSGYGGLHTTPRYFKPRFVRKTKLEFSPDRQTRVSGHLYRSLLPYSIPTILIFSILFGSFIGRNTEDRRNLKYDSIRFGLENSPSPLEVLNTETGESLGGKKAAIQFYYDRRQTDLTS